MLSASARDLGAMTSNAPSPAGSTRPPDNVMICSMNSRSGFIAIITASCFEILGEQNFVQSFCILVGGFRPQQLIGERIKILLDIFTRCGLQPEIDHDIAKFFICLKIAQEAADFSYDKFKHIDLVVQQMEDVFLDASLDTKIEYEDIPRLSDPVDPTDTLL